MDGFGEDVNEGTKGVVLACSSRLPMVLGSASQALVQYSLSTRFDTSKPK